MKFFKALLLAAVMVASVPAHATLGRIGSIEVDTRTTGTGTTFTGDYSPGAGSNRCVAARVMQRGLGAPATDITWKGTSRSPTVSADDSAGVNRTSSAIFVFKESEVAAGGTSYTVTFSSTAYDVAVIWETIGDCDQTTTVRTSGSAAATSSSNLTSDVSQTVTVGDYQIAALSFRGNEPGGMVPQHSWAEDYDASSGDNTGTFGASYLVATGTSSPFQWLLGTGGDSDYSIVAVAFIPYAGGGGSSPVQIIIQQMSRNDAANDSDFHPPLLAKVAP